MATDKSFIYYQANNMQQLRSMEETAKKKQLDHFSLYFWYLLMVCANVPNNCISCYLVVVPLVQKNLNCTNSKKPQVTQQYVCISCQCKQETHQHQKISGRSEIHKTWQVSQSFLYLSSMDQFIFINNNNTMY